MFKRQAIHLGVRGRNRARNLDEVLFAGRHPRLWIVVCVVFRHLLPEAIFRPRGSIHVLRPQPEALRTSFVNTGQDVIANIQIGRLVVVPEDQKLPLSGRNDQALADKTGLSDHLQAIGPEKLNRMYAVICSDIHFEVVIHVIVFAMVLPHLDDMDLRLRVHSFPHRLSPCLPPGLRMDPLWRLACFGDAKFTTFQDSVNAAGSAAAIRRRYTRVETIPPTSGDCTRTGHHVWKPHVPDWQTSNMTEQR
ncbi:hypothetical protein [Lysobacter capsici]|uniref:hypothetical protein n=1 Tax=Lysobacter capsici TaxID=435897 RepID=UPI001C003D7B|nr:hypothetical protein [Lysobacter capsici]QWF19047.1 hypothetical protein KME82_10075 [Lysobacter capsici]